MTTFLIRWTADTLHGKRWGEFEHADISKAKAREWFWRHFSGFTGLDPAEVAALDVIVQVVGTMPTPVTFYSIEEAAAADVAAPLQVA
jgi:hypothetical protein